MDKKPASLNRADIKKLEDSLRAADPLTWPDTGFGKASRLLMRQYFNALADEVSLHDTLTEVEYKQEIAKATARIHEQKFSPFEGATPNMVSDEVQVLREKFEESDFNAYLREKGEGIWEDKLFYIVKYAQQREDMIRGFRETDPNYLDEQVRYCDRGALDMTMKVTENFMNNFFTALMPVEEKQQATTNFDPNPAPGYHSKIWLTRSGIRPMLQAFKKETDFELARNEFETRQQYVSGQFFEDIIELVQHHMDEIPPDRETPRSHIFMHKVEQLVETLHVIYQCQLMDTMPEGESRIVTPEIVEKTDVAIKHLNSLVDDSAYMVLLKGLKLYDDAGKLKRDEYIAKKTVLDQEFCDHCKKYDPDRGNDAAWEQIYLFEQREELKTLETSFEKVAQICNNHTEHMLGDNDRGR